MVVKRNYPNYDAAISYVAGERSASPAFRWIARAAPGMAVDMRHMVTRNSARAGE
jgi:hypothetical protein